MITPSSSSSRKWGGCLTCSLATTDVECDGKRPTCSRCAEAGASCRWGPFARKRGRKPGISKKRMLALYRKSSFHKLRKACTKCSDLKRRCDSEKPSCSFCRTRQLRCEYGSYKAKLPKNNSASIRKATIFQIFHKMEVSTQFGEIFSPVDLDAIGFFLGYCEESLPAFSPSLYFKCLEHLETEPRAQTTLLCLVLLKVAIACGVVLGGFNSHLQGNLDQIDSALFLLASISADNQPEAIIAGCSPPPSSLLPTDSYEDNDDANSSQNNHLLLNLHLDLLLDLAKCQPPNPRGNDVLLAISSMLDRTSSFTFLGSIRSVETLATVKASRHWSALTLQSSGLTSNENELGVSSGLFPFFNDEEMACFPAECQAFLLAQSTLLRLPLFTGIPFDVSDTLDDFCCVLEAIYSHALYAADCITMSSECLILHQFVVSNLFCAVLEITMQGQAQAGLARCEAIARRLQENAALLTPGTILLHLAAPSWATPLRLLAYTLWLGGLVSAAEKVVSLHNSAATARGLAAWAWLPGEHPLGRALGPAAAGEPDQVGPVFGRLRALVALGLAMRGASQKDQRRFLYKLCVDQQSVWTETGSGGCDGIKEEK